MATFADLKPHHRLFMNGYPFSRYAVKDNPCQKLKKPVEQTKFALITSAGLRLPEDLPFDHSFKFGDVSFREIANDIVEVQSLVEDHKSSSFDHSGVQADKNLALPIERFRELVERKVIGSLNHRSFSFMGSIISPGKLIKETALEVAEKLVEDEVEAVLLTPV